MRTWAFPVFLGLSDKTGKVRKLDDGEFFFPTGVFEMLLLGVTYHLEEVLRGVTRLPIVLQVVAGRPEEVS